MFHFSFPTATLAINCSRLAFRCSGVKLSTRFISFKKRSASFPNNIGVSLIGLAIINVLQIFIVYYFRGKDTLFI